MFLPYSISAEIPKFKKKGVNSIPLILNFLKIFHQAVFNKDLLLKGC